MTKRPFRRVIAAALVTAGFAMAATVPAMAQNPGMAQDGNNNGSLFGSGYGPGYGPMMGGAYGYGMGPDYGMGYYGGYSHGWGGHSGMMGGYGAGYGPGMMYGGYGNGMGYGPGMMWGAYGWGPETAGALGLSESQQKQIREIQERLGKRQWGLMQAMHGQMRHLWRSYYGKGEDIDAIIKARRTMFDMRLQMLRNRLEAQKQIRAVLTEAQRKQLDEIEGWGSNSS